MDRFRVMDEWIFLAQTKKKIQFFWYETYRKKNKRKTYYDRVPQSRSSRPTSFNGSLKDLCRLWQFMKKDTMWCLYTGLFIVRLQCRCENQLCYDKKGSWSHGCHLWLLLASVVAAHCIMGSRMWGRLASYTHRLYMKTIYLEDCLFILQNWTFQHGGSIEIVLIVWAAPGGQSRNCNWINFLVHIWI